MTSLAKRFLKDKNGNRVWAKAHVTSVYDDNGTPLSTLLDSTGTVTSVVGGTGLDGGTINTSGTLSVKYGTTSGTACEGNDSRLSDARPASDVSAWAKASTKPTYKASEVMSISSQSISANTSSSCSITGSSNNGKHKLSYMSIMVVLIIQ